MGDRLVMINEDSKEYRKSTYREHPLLLRLKSSGVGRTPRPAFPRTEI